MDLTDRIKFVGGYAGRLKEVCHSVKDCKPQGIHDAASLLDVIVPPCAILVPMPSHTGRAKQTLDICKELSEMCSFRTVCDCLVCEPHESAYERKKNGLPPQRFTAVCDLKMLDEMLKGDGRGTDIAIIDTVVSSGTTAREALLATPRGKLYVLARDCKTSET